jgi:hypothetical protein
MAQYLILDDVKGYLNIDHETENDDELTLLMNASEQIVQDYLGYDPLENTYTDELYDGEGTNYLYLKHIPITNVSALSVGDVDITSDISVREREVTYKEGTYPEGIDNVKITYTAGYPLAALPEIIKMTAMRICGVLFSERDRIGINSRSDSFSGSSTYFQVRLGWYLEPLKEYRI